MDLNTPQPESQQNLIPDFSRAEAIAVLMFVMELIALLLTLTVNSNAEIQLPNFLMLSLHLQWVALSSAFVLVLSRRWLKLARASVVFFVCWGLMVVVTLLTADAAWWLAHAFNFIPPIAGTREGFLIRNVLSGAIVSLLVLRYFWSRAQLQTQAALDSEARYLALQARIRPHFLFNSLNSIAALIQSKPEQAEEMVIDLADLFRVSLDKSNRLVRLAEEIEFVKTYMRIEQVRLGEKLWVNWEIEAEALEARVPLLVLQPLVENAVYHGVSRLVGRGGITVTARRELGMLAIDVENPIPPESAPEKKGTGVAMENIAQRLKLIYGQQGRLIQGPHETDTGMVYRARIQVPFKIVDSATPQAANESKE